MKENFMSRFNQALNRPIRSRCAELTVLFDRGTLKDFQLIFPALIDNIFGPQGSSCWELRSVTACTNAQDFQALQHFLSPVGPLFKVIYMLLRDQQIKYDFSLLYLPNKIRMCLESGAVHPFYVDLIRTGAQTNHIVSLFLNPFDYYFFHFAYHLINPWHQRSTNTHGTAWSTIYYILCCDYVLHFFPTNPSYKVLPFVDYYNGKNPAQVLPAFTKSPKMSKLLRSNVFADTLNDLSAIHQSLEHHPRKEIWRSETVLTVFIDMWLSNDQIVEAYPSFSIASNRQPFQFNELPTGEYIRIIRVLVKQLHAFSSSGKVDDTHMGELKKLAIPYLQGKMYMFLRNLIHRWPLDGSFRLVLELWLSFIQPWRYLGNDYLKPKHQLDINPDLDDINTASGTSATKTVERENLPFLTENLLAYTVILQQLLPRFTRIDLASPKNSLMLYRLTKVFGQPNLVSLLKEIESSLDNLNDSTAETNNIWSNPQQLPPLSPTSAWSKITNKSVTFATQPQKQEYVSLNPPLWENNMAYRTGSGKLSGIVKQKILELEGPTFCYKPMFTVDPPSEVFDLVWHIKKAENTAFATIHARLDEIKQQSQGISGFFKTIFMQTDTTNDEFTLEERKKVPLYLDFSLQNLVDIFQLKDLKLKETQPVEEQSSTHSPTPNNFPFLLTPEKVRERLKTIKYEGDPDLYPVRTNENTFLVRVLYQLASKMNENLGPKLNVLYHKENYWGSLARQILSPPITIYKYDKTQSGASPRVPQSLPPRLSFRYLSSHKFLAYMFLGILFFKLLGYNTVSFVFIVFIAWFVYVCIKAVFATDDNRRLNNRQRLDFDLNDSLQHET